MIRSFADIDKSELRGMMRRVDGLGRILVPMEYRRELGLEKDVRIEIAVLDDGMLIRPLGVAVEIPGFPAARRIDSLGRINIPVMARRMLDIAFHDELEMFLLRDGMFIRKKMA
jgi:bifunctional DNA-binding transcriptional regulator/antitoxin component of YhaV-PrlF toxin-antitoxin module